MARRSRGEQQDAMGSIHERMVTSGMGRACNLIVRRNDRWVQVRGNINSKGKFIDQYDNPIEVPENLNAHCTTETAMKLLVAWIIEESRHPGKADGLFVGNQDDYSAAKMSIPLPIQRIDLGGDTALLVLCGEDGKPVRKGAVEDWPTHAEIIEESVQEQNRQ